MGLKANADGSGAIQVGGSDAITITSGLNTTFAGTAAVPTGTLYPLVSGTAVASTSGTSIDFTSIPSWVKRITVMFNEISTNGVSPLIVQIGDSGGFETTGYIGISSVIAGSNTTSPNILTNGYYVRLMDGANTELLSGTMTINLITGTTWVSSHVCCQNIAGATPKTAHGAGTKTLTETLDRVRITTFSGTPTFDAGSINILYE
jgi:hypothetical protein